MKKTKSTRGAGFFVFMGMLALIFPPCSFGADQLRWNAHYLYKIDPRISGASFSGIGDIFIDNAMDEVFVLDNGNSRVVITGTDGTFLFQFSFADAGIKGWPRNIVVGDDDLIYVTEEGRIVVIGYNGMYVKDLDLSSIPDAAGMVIQSIAIRGDNLYIGVGGKDARVIVLDRKREKFITQYTGEFGNNVKLGLDSSGFYVMAPTLASVFRFDEDGNYLGRFGNISSLAGGFSQIVDIYVDRKNGRLVITDYNRAAVLFFDRNGDFLFEFGGASTFRSPSIAAVDEFDKVYVADGTNTIRVFKIEVERLEDPKVDAGPEPEPALEPKLEPESKPESGREPKLEPESKPKPESEPESGQEPKLEPESKPEPESPAGR